MTTIDPPAVFQFTAVQCVELRDAQVRALARGRGGRNGVPCIALIAQRRATSKPLPDP